jgi:hypothetical protein
MFRVDFEKAGVPNVVDGPGRGPFTLSAVVSDGDMTGQMDTRSQLGTLTLVETG